MDEVIHRPNLDEAKQYVKMFNSDENGLCKERVLQRVFADKNDEVEDVVLRIAVLDQIYSTQIRKHTDICDLARHIKNIGDLQERLWQGDLEVVDEIANVNGRNLFSFATKYCSFSSPREYYIYDTLVNNLLRAINRQYPFVQKFGPDDLRSHGYEYFNDVMGYFAEEFGLKDTLSKKELDIYLWQWGKEFAVQAKEGQG